MSDAAPKPYPISAIIAVGIILPLLAVFATVLRFWVRLRVQPTRLGIDDWLILGAVIICVGDGANLAIAAIYGILGRSFSGQPPDDRALFEANSDFAQVVIEKPLYGMMKLSVLFFYRRIFSINQTFRRFNDVMIVLIAAWTLAFFIGEFCVCGGSRQAMWSGGAHGVCQERNWLHLSFAVTDVIGDVLVVAMPFPFLSGLLTIGRREKVAVVAIFALGALSTAASIVRLGFISQAVSDARSGSGKKASGDPPALWSTVEAAIGCFAANLPPLGPLIRKAPSPRKMSVKMFNKYRSYSQSHSGRKASAAVQLHLDSDSEKGLRKESSNSFMLQELNLTEIEVGQKSGAQHL